MVHVSENMVIIDNPRATLEDKAEFEAAVSRLTQEGARLIMVDLSRTTYLPSELMGYLMGKKKEFLDRGMDIRITAISAPLKHVFDDAKISDFFQV